jgi:GT2 family glycosyltransferase
VDVSVIIPCFNRGSWVARALRSVYAQTLAPREVIVVDDGSSDDTAERVKGGFPQARYLWQPNGGVSSARNRGIEEARGTWVAFLDSDDEWLPEKLRAQRDAVRGSPGYRICHCDEVWMRRGQPVSPSKRHAKQGGLIFQRCLPLCVISPSAVLIHRSVWARAGMFDEALPACEDYDLWLRICAEYPVLFVATPLLVKHGGHGDQLSHRYWGMDRFRIRALEKILCSGRLSEADRRAALEVLLAKIRIYSQGAEKRGRREEASVYRSKYRHFRCWLGDPHTAGVSGR